MSELARIIELLVQIIENQQAALDRSASEQSTPEFNLKDWGLPEEVMAILPISLRTLYRYRQIKKKAWIKVGGRSYYHLPTFFDLKNQCMK